jgi:hypothetical protein
LKTVSELKKNFPHRKFSNTDASAFGVRGVHQPSSYAVAKMDAQGFSRTMRPACYWSMFQHINKDTLLIPRIGYDPKRAKNKLPTGLAPRIFLNVLKAFQEHGFFPVEAEFIPNTSKKSWEVLLPAKSCTRNSMKLAAFLYRDMECQHPETVLLAYRQWLALKKQGVTLWQCFHWAYAKSGWGAGHGIYHFNGPFRWTPLLALAFAQFCRTPVSSLTMAPYNENYLTASIDKIVQKLMGGVKVSVVTEVPEEGLLNPELGKLMQNPKKVKITKFREVMNSLPGGKQVDKGRIRDYYW